MPDMIRTTRPQARKTHLCMLCHAAVPAGATYTRSVYLGDLGPYTWVQCADCDEVIDAVVHWAVDSEAGVTDVDAHAWATEHAPEDPDAAAYLARWNAAA